MYKICQEGGGGQKSISRTNPRNLLYFILKLRNGRRYDPQFNELPVPSFHCCLCISYVYISHMSMYLICLCISYVYVSHMSMYLICLCISYVFVSHMSMYLICLCISYVYVSHMPMYLICLCISYVHIMGHLAAASQPVLASALSPLGIWGGGPKVVCHDMNYLFVSLKCLFSFAVSLCKSDLPLAHSLFIRSNGKINTFSTISFTFSQDKGFNGTFLNRAF